MTRLCTIALYAFFAIGGGYLATIIIETAAHASVYHGGF